MVFEVLVPRIGVNEDFVKLVEWRVGDGDYIDEGSTLCTVETTKASFEIEAEHKGFVKTLVKKGEKVLIQTALCLLADSLDELDSYVVTDATPESTESEIAATRKAIELANKLGIDLKDIKKDGLIKEKDIEEFNRARTGIAPEQDIFLMQDIHTSWGDIPHSYVEKMVDVTGINDFVTRYIEIKKQAISMLTVFIKGTALALAKYPEFNAYHERGSVRTYQDINIGIVIGHNGKLTIPVIKNADKLSLGEISTLVSKLTIQVHKGTVKINDLTDKTFVVTSLSTHGIHRIFPLIPPKIGATLSIPSPYTMVFPSEDGGIESKQLINLGLSFDHIFLDGVRAAAFLNQIEKFCQLEAQKDIE